MNLLKTMPVQLLIPYIYPTLYSLHNMPNEAGEVGENGVVLPPRLNLSGEKLEPHGCYLLENGQNIYIWVGRGVVQQLCLDLFDVKSYEGLRGGKVRTIYLLYSGHSFHFAHNPLCFVFRSPCLR
jgi:protein transport protein SEC24